MPLIDAPEVQGVQPYALPDWFTLNPVEEGKAPTMSETAWAGLRNVNSVLNAGMAIRRARDHALYGASDPNFDPLEHIQGTDLEPYADHFYAAQNGAQAAAIAQSIRQEMQDQETLRRSGWLGTVAQIGAGIFDWPTLFASMRVASVPSLLRGGTALARAGRGAYEAGIVGGLTAAGSEAGLQATQETRTWEDSAVGIGGSVFLSMILGAGAGLLSRDAFHGLSDGLKRDFTTPAKSADDPLGEGGLKILSTVGAQQVDQDVKIKGALGVEKILKFQDPLIRTLSSPSKETRVAAARLAEVPISLEGDVISPGGAVETIVKGRQNTRMFQFSTALEDAYSRYRFGRAKKFGDRLRRLNTQGGEYLSFKEFKERVGMAARNGDEDIIPEVADAAKAWRRHVADPGKNDAIAAGLLDEDVKPETATSYLTRVYNKTKIIARSDKFDGMVSEWLASRNIELENELRQLKSDVDSGAAAKVKAEGANAKRIATIEEELRSSPAEQRAIAESIRRTILSGEEGRVMYKLPATVRGPLRERTFMIPDNFEARDGTKFTDFLENDIEHVARAYNRTIIPDTAIKQAFGDLDLKDVLQKMNDEADVAAKAATSEKARIKIEKQLADDKRDIKAMADRIRGIYGMTGQPNGWTRAARVLRSLNYVRLLGGMTLSAISDVGKVLFLGLDRSFGSVLVPLVSNFSGLKMAMREVKLSGTALDMALDSRIMAMHDIMDNYGRASKFERGLHGAQQVFTMASLMAPWNATLKQIAGTMAMSNILEAASTWARTGKLKAKLIQNLADGRIDEALSQRIASQFEKYGEKQGGLWLPNTEEWTDDVAREALRSAIARDVDRIIVTPGQDKPLWMSTEFGKTLGQFRSFGVSSIQRTLIAGLQQRDAHVMSALMLMMGLGMLRTKIYTTIAGTPEPENTAQWIAAGADSSGLFGWLFDANNLAEKATGYGLSSLTGKEQAKYQSRDFVSSLAGPVAGLISDAKTAAWAAGHGEWSDGDIRALRRLIPAQNLFYIRTLFDKMEEGLRDELPRKAVN